MSYSHEFYRPAADRSNVRLCGNVLKRSGSNSMFGSNWNQRYVVLAANLLFLYSSSKDAKPRKVLLLDDCVATTAAVEGHPFVFIITTRGKTVVRCAVESQAQAETWATCCANAGYKQAMAVARMQAAEMAAAEAAAGAGAGAGTGTGTGTGTGAGGGYTQQQLDEACASAAAAAKDEASATAASVRNELAATLAKVQQLTADLEHARREAAEHEHTARNNADDVQRTAAELNAVKAERDALRAQLEAATAAAASTATVGSVAAAPPTPPSATPSRVLSPSPAPAPTTATATPPRQGGGETKAEAEADAGADTLMRVQHLERELEASQAHLRTAASELKDTKQRCDVLLTQLNDIEKQRATESMAYRREVDELTAQLTAATQAQAIVSKQVQALQEARQGETKMTAEDVLDGGGYEGSPSAHGRTPSLVVSQGAAVTGSASNVVSAHPTDLHIAKLRQQAAALLAAGHVVEAERQYAAVLEACQANDRADAMEIAQAQRDVANVMAHQARYVEAEALFDQVVETTVNELGEAHANSACALTDLAATCKAQGKLAKAEECSARAVACLRRCGADKGTVATALYNLAGISRRQGKAAAAEKSYLQALHMYEMTPGKHDSEAADTMYQLGSLYKQKYQYREALQQYQAAADAYSKAYGEDDEHSKRAAMYARKMQNRVKAVA